MEKTPEELVEEWLDSKDERTGATYRLFWKRFEEFTDMNAREILNSRYTDFELPHHDPKRWKWETVAKRFYKSLYGDGNPTGTDKQHLVAIRSFFAYYRVDLKFRKKELPQPQSSSKYYNFNINELAAMIKFATPTEQWIVAGGKSLGQRAGDFAALKRKDIEPWLDDEPPIPIEIKTQKISGVTAHPCLDADAVEAAKRLLASRTDNNPYMISGYSGNHLQGQMLTKIIQKLADAAHAENPRILKWREKELRIRFHDLGRRFLSASLKDTAIDPDLIDWIVGHKLSDTKRAYTSTQVRAAYSQASHRLLFPRSQNNVTPKVDKRLEDLLNILIATMPPEFVKQWAQRIVSTKFSVDWDPRREPKPMIYLLQEALKRAGL